MKTSPRLLQFLFEMQALMSPRYESRVGSAWLTMFSCKTCHWNLVFSSLLIADSRISASIHPDLMPVLWFYDPTKKASLGTRNL